MGKFEDNSPIVLKIYSKKLVESNELCPNCGSVLYVRKVSKITENDTHIDDIELYCKSCDNTTKGFWRGGSLFQFLKRVLKRGRGKD